MREAVSLALALASLGALFVAAPAAASPSARLVYLRNAGADSCPDENAVRGAVAARLGYDPFFPNASETMFIEISREGDSYRARVKLVAGDNNVRGTREIVQAGDSCSGIIDTLALSMSIAIDPDSLMRAPPPAADETATTPPAQAPPLAAESAPASSPSSGSPSPADSPVPPRNARDRSARPRPEVWLAPALWVGSGPTTAFGGEIGARLRWSHLSLGGSFRGDLPASRTVDRVAVGLSFVGGSADACGHFGFLEACGHGTLGALHASGAGPRGHDDTSTRFLLGASVGGELPASAAIAMFARVIGNASIGDQTVVVAGANAYDLPHLSIGLEVGSSLRF